MIEVIIRHRESGAQIGRITVENLTESDSEYADYSVQFGVEKGKSVGIHRRGIFGFPRKKYNVFALLLQALSTLEPKELEWDGDWGERHSMDELKAIKRRNRFW